MVSLEFPASSHLQHTLGTIFVYSYMEMEGSMSKKLCQWDSFRTYVLQNSHYKLALVIISAYHI